jgi:hypothetical protein
MCQYAVRKYLVRKKLNALRRVAACAVLLQAWARGRIALRNFTQRQRNIIVLQSVIRKRIVRKKYIATMRGKSMLCELLDKDEIVDLNFDTSFLLSSAAVVCQRIARGNITHKKDAKIKHEKDMSRATSNLIVLRGISALLRVFEYRTSAIAVQTATRGFLARKHYHEDKKSESRHDL